jgi:hypothetical protein
MQKDDLKYYRFSYLIHAYGGLHKVLFSKQSWDFYLAIIVTALIMSLHKFEPLISSQIVFVFALDLALLGLILATYPIIFSIQDVAFLRALVLSKTYQYLLFQAAWTSIWIFTSIGLFGFLVIVKFTLCILAPAIFFMVYGFLGTVVIVAFSFRKFAVQAARRTPELIKAWEDEENDKGLK